MPRLASVKPQRYVNPNNPLLHAGVVSVTGSLTVDLGIGHRNFIADVSVVAADATALGALTVGWTYGSRPGTFTILVNDAGVASVAAVSVSFTAQAASSVVA